MKPEDHPAHRPSRYHWAALKSPLHVWGAALGWSTSLITGMLSAVDPALASVSASLVLATILWHVGMILGAPVNPTYRRKVDRSLANRYEGDFNFHCVLLQPRIHKDLTDKVGEITRLRNRGREILTGKFGDYDVFAQENMQKLDTLAISYLQLLVALSEYDEYLSLVNPDSIEREYDRARQEAAEAEDKALREAKQRELGLLKNRMERYRQADARMKLIQAQIRNVETTLKLLVDQAMTAQDAKKVGYEIDQVLDNMEASDVLNAEIAEFQQADLDVSRTSSLDSFLSEE